MPPMRRITLLLILVCITAVPTFRLQAQTSSRTYTVQSGDTLTSIAARFGISVAALAQANQIAETDVIYVGQVLKIPGTAGASPGITVPAVPSAGLPPGTYVVQPGDTLAGIEQRLNTSIFAIEQANHLDNPDSLPVGQRLRLPDA